MIYAGHWRSHLETKYSRPCINQPTSSNLKIRKNHTIFLNNPDCSLDVMLSLACNELSRNGVGIGSMDSCEASEISSRPLESVVVG